ncbi:helix-turn-helix domain-containing protein [Arenibacter algicola]|uniref:helix-turn-helix transcriptional regulator n=1 Tax=Arenibacter algicola TaxID=616991 RepID=UPI001C0764DA|nr:helix-turn-helix domain-containing protein [Arenibacter algicola]MBU2905363.1 helix-turn-helix domain-containing protein [Arenibacter algicola]
MEENENVVGLLSDIKGLLSHTKKVMNVEDLAAYTGLSKSKIYKLTQLKLIPMGNNRHIRQKFFDKDTIDAWLLGEPDLSDETLEHRFNESLIKNKR